MVTGLRAQSVVFCMREINLPFELLSSGYTAENGIEDDISSLSRRLQRPFVRALITKEVRLRLELSI